MHFANCVALAAVLYIILIRNSRLCSSAEAGIVLNLGLVFFLVFLQTEKRLNYNLQGIKDVSKNISLLYFIFIILNFIFFRYTVS